MKMKILKITLLAIVTSMLQSLTAQTYDITAEALKFEYECYACGKKDVYYFWNWDMNKVTSNCPNFNTDKNVQGRVRDVIIAECQSLTIEEGNPGIVQLDASLIGLTTKPKVQPLTVCSRNTNSSYHDVNKNAVGVVYNLKTTITKDYLDKWVKFYKTQQDKEESDQKAAQEKKEEQEKKLREFTEKFELKFADLIKGKNTAEKGDSTGIDLYKSALFEIIDMGGGIEKADFSKIYTNRDSFQWSLRGLVADLGMLYLYCGLYERGIKEIDYLHEKVDPSGERIHLVLGMAYLMNCQHIKATAVWQQCKNSSYYPCEIYGKVDNLIKEMRVYRPELKCIKGLRTIPVLAAIICPQ